MIGRAEFAIPWAGLRQLEMNGSATRVTYRDGRSEEVEFGKSLFGPAYLTSGDCSMGDDRNPTEKFSSFSRIEGTDPGTK